jgi:mannitol/fructose-specific phosphotransferase system IIA component (Ntr-type)
LPFNANKSVAIALVDLLHESQIALHLRAQTRDDAMRELIDLLADSGKIDNREKFLEQVCARERSTSTYAADGVAFPHARTEFAAEISLAVGRSEIGIPWTGRGEIAHLIFLIAVPEKLISDYLVVIGAIARATKDAPLRTLLLHAETPPEFIATMLSAPTI